MDLAKDPIADRSADAEEFKLKILEAARKYDNPDLWNSVHELFVSVEFMEALSNWVRTGGPKPRQKGEKTGICGRPREKLETLLTSVKIPRPVGRPTAAARGKAGDDMEIIEVMARRKRQSPKLSERAILFQIALERYKPYHSEEAATRKAKKDLNKLRLMVRRARQRTA